MSPDPSPPEHQSDDSATASNYKRRRVLTMGAGIGTVLLAGCSTGTNSSIGSGGSTTDKGSGGSTETTGTFRLLISDQPADIGDFDVLNVSFDRARVFRDDDDDDVTEEETETVTETETETKTETATVNETVTEDEEDEEDEEENEGDDVDERGFFVIDLEGETVDLTQVVGEKAIGVFDGEITEGQYSKIELYVADVEGIVDGEAVEVKVPSGKLQIVTPFEVVAGESLTFVFDINVVRKGQTGEYNLLPVISESGVVGEDIEAEEIENGEADADVEKTESGEAETEEEAGDDGESGDGEDEAEDGVESGDGEDEGAPDDTGANS